MIVVNGRNFKVYTLDTLNSIKNRISYELKTLPGYLYFPLGESTLSMESGTKVEVKDLLKEIRDSSDSGESIDKFLDRIKPVLPKNIVMKDIIFKWLLYNRKLREDEKIAGDVVLDGIIDTLVYRKHFFTKSSFLREWVDKKKHGESDFKSLLENQQSGVDQDIKLFKMFDNTEEFYTESDEYERVDFDIFLTLRMSLLEIFNSIVLNTGTPFATTNNFYKILKDYIPPDKWSETAEESIILKVSKRENIFGVKTHDYSDVVVSKEGEDVKMYISVSKKKGNISRDKFIDRVFELFRGVDMKIRNIFESKVVGVFYIPQVYLNKYVFSDLVMNDTLFSRLMNIDEHEKATKTKSGLYIHFHHPSTGNVTANISQKTVTKNDPFMKDKDKDFFPLDTVYIRIRVTHANNTKSMDIFKKMMSKLFTIYMDKFENIIKIYREFIPDFGVVEMEDKEDVKEDERLIDIAPDIFIKNYSRLCTKAPTVISEEDALDAVEKKKSVMKFPRDIPEDEKAVRFPMDGEDQNYYTCDHKTHKYVGLISNNLKNSDIYPYLPCCYKNNQTGKPYYKYYYEGIEPNVEEKKEYRDIIKTDKFLKYDQFGYLPDNIENLFSLVDPGAKFTYVRKGVFGRHVNSFINVIMEALDEETNIINIINEEKENDIFEIFTKVREDMSNKNNVPLCRQEMYDSNIKQIVAILKNRDTYLDPKLFIHLLEDRFNCNIYLFTRDEMILPRHTQAYYKHKNRSRCIYVYENLGSESDRGSYPQCELIVKYNTDTGRTQDLFTYEDAKNVRDVYEMVRESYALNKRIKETVGIPWRQTKGIEIISQGIDSYGKTRKINIKYKGDVISLLTDPIQPIKIRETRKGNIYNANSITTALKIAGMLEIKVHSQSLTKDVVKQINGVLGNVKVSIPVVDSEKSLAIPVSDNVDVYPRTGQSDLYLYNRNKKLARYLVEYVFWTYSRYLRSRDVKNITDDGIADFAKRKFRVIEDYNYGEVPKILSEKSTFFKNKKLVVTSLEILKRLIYVLRLSVVRNRDNILQYYKRKVINNYYVDITDFDKYSSQVILYGENSVENWISENISYKLYDRVVIGTRPYFFKNTLIDNEVYLAQNTRTMGKISDIASKWIKNGYNVGIYADEGKEISFPLYNYAGPSDITRVSNNGNKKIKVLKYIIDDIHFFTVLLKLD